MPFFYVDWYYIVLVLPAVILSLWASAHVKSTFRRYSQVRNARGMTGAEAAMAVLRAHGVTDVRVRGAIGVVELERIDDLNALRRAFVGKGAFIRPIGNVVYLTPAFTIGEEDVVFLTRAIAQVLRERA